MSSRRWCARHAERASSSTWTPRASRKAKPMRLRTSSVPQVARDLDLCPGEAFGCVIQLAVEGHDPPWPMASGRGYEFPAAGRRVTTTRWPCSRSAHDPRACARHGGSDAVHGHDAGDEFPTPGRRQTCWLRRSQGTQAVPEDAERCGSVPTVADTPRPPYAGILALRWVSASVAGLPW
jgi:hypothetical protein